MSDDRHHRQTAPDPWHRRPVTRPVRRMSAGDDRERRLEEGLRQLGRDLLDEPVPQHLRDILAAARDRRG